MIKKIQQLQGNNKPSPPLKMMLILNKYKKQNPFTPIKFLPKMVLKRLSPWFKNQLQNPAMLKMWNLHLSSLSKKKHKRSCLQLVKSMVIKNKFWRNSRKILYNLNTIKKLNNKLLRCLNKNQLRSQVKKMKLCRNLWKILYNKNRIKRLKKSRLRKSRLKKMKLCKNLWKILFNKNKQKMISRISNKYYLP